MVRQVSRFSLLSYYSRQSQYFIDRFVHGMYSLDKDPSLQAGVYNFILSLKSHEPQCLRVLRSCFVPLGRPPDSLTESIRCPSTEQNTYQHTLFAIEPPRDGCELGANRGRANVVLRPRWRRMRHGFCPFRHWICRALHRPSPSRSFPCRL